MLNIYPGRSTVYNALPTSVDPEAYSEYLTRIEALIASEHNPVVWAA